LGVSVDADHLKPFLLGQVDGALYHRPPKQSVSPSREPNRATVYSLRLSQKERAIAYRDGDFLRLI
jgi:hypothetical protein